jgi:hypothetical protein
MPVYKIADLNIKINPLYPDTEKRISPYLCDSVDFDFDASCTAEEFERKKAESENGCTDENIEGAVILTKIAKTVLTSYGGCFFHSSCLEIDGEAYMFTALSGTGKSTHTRNWRRLFRGRVTMINDDKPIIRKLNGRYTVCSTPWMGKSDIGCNMSVPIKAIYVLRRGDSNSAVEVRPVEVFRELMEATLLPETRDDMGKLLDLFDGLFTGVKLFLLTCTPDIESAQVAYDAANK